MDNLLTRVCIYIPEDCLYLSKNADPHVMPSYAVVYVPVYRFIKQQSLTLMSTSNVPPKYLFERLTLESWTVQSILNIIDTSQLSVFASPYIVLWYEKIRKKENIRNWSNQITHLTQDNIWESDKTQDNITFKRAKRSALSQQLATRLHGTDKTVWQTNMEHEQQKWPTKEEFP